MASSTKRSKPIKEQVPFSPADELINEMIRKRKLQQEALLKIMTSIDAKKKKKTKATKVAKSKTGKNQKIN